jgi:hypothetical protein
MSVAGCSKTLLEASVPYAQRALEKYIGPFRSCFVKGCSVPTGYKPRKYVSFDTARDMAFAAYQRAKHLITSPKKGQYIVGISYVFSLCPLERTDVEESELTSPNKLTKGCTAAIRTLRERRGRHHAYLCSWDGTTLRSWYAVLNKERTRQEQDALISAAIIRLLAEHCHIEWSEELSALSLFSAPDESFTVIFPQHQT